MSKEVSLTREKFAIVDDHLIWHLINRCDRMELLQWTKPSVA